MSGKKKLKFKPNEWNPRVPWFVSYYSVEDKFVRRMCRRKERHDTKNEIRSGKYEDAGKRHIKGTEGWLRW